MKQGAGQTPVWNETFEFDVKNTADDLVIEVLDDDVGSDEKVGETTIKLSSFCIGTGIDTWIDIQWKGKGVGQVHLQSFWHPK